jgi:DNA-binding transcriptional regulator YhcF (GntR family)
VLKLLRQTAKKNRRETAQLFYSIREVALRFKMPMTTISRHYQQLIAEGFLCTFWGSKTMITASAKPIKRGIYVIPISVAHLTASEPYRNYVLRLHRQLRKRGIAE